MNDQKLKKLFLKVGVNPDFPPDATRWKELIASVDRLISELRGRKTLLENTLATSTQEMERIYEELKTKSESEMTQIASKFRTLFDSSPLPHFVFDGVGMIDCNMAAVTIMEAKNKSELLGKHPFEFSPDYQPDGHLSKNKAQEVLREVAQHGLNRFDWTHITLSGKTIPVEVTLAPIKLAGKEVILALWKDLTDIKEKEQKLIQSSKMSSLGEMAGGIAHEINNPLAIISGKANSLKRQLKAGSIAPDKAEQELTKIETTAGRIAKIIKGLRSFSRNAEADPMEKVQLSRIVEDTLELCRERFRNHSIDLRITYSELIHLECRPTQISQVLINLLGNAHDAVENLSEKWVLLEAVQESDSVTISITDSGGGIPKNVVDKMMNPFFTTKEVGKGTGLGLSISKGIIEDHHGIFKYDLRSKNTRFVIKLPLRQSKYTEVGKEAA